ncbi:MAG: energy-coupling factor ABC transporter permease, partial [Desulfuromonadaceae bacterium]
LILSILLGPHAAFLTIASVLVVQAFFFADGGLLALGCNIFNLGFFPAFIAYPLVYKKIAGGTLTPARISVASMAAAIIALQTGAFGVVMETVLSGVSALPFPAFALIMQPIHLAIGVVEGLVTASVISFLFSAKPEILRTAMEAGPANVHPIRAIVPAILAVTLLTGGVASQFASEKPDGLEWSISEVTRQKGLAGSKHGIHGSLALLQKKISFLPEYSFGNPGGAKPPGTPADQSAPHAQDPAEHAYEANKLGASVSGVVGGALTLGLSLLIGLLLKCRNKAAENVVETDG